MTTMALENFDRIFEFLATYPQHHARDTPFYHFINGVTKHAFREARSVFEAGRKVPIGEFGLVNLPYEKMGAIDSIDLFGLDELMMFAFYYRNRGRYARAADIGANIGLHSILLSMSGCKVESFEPDPKHHSKLLVNLERNHIIDCTAHKAAVSDRDGKSQFVRVLGNTTSSHLEGSKTNPYGDLERFDVEVKDIRGIADRVDLMKIDAEGHEAVILNALPTEAWGRIDAFVEIGSTANARAVFDRFNGTGVNVFTQKSGWARIETIEHMPVSYKEGGIFISAKHIMPW